MDTIEEKDIAIKVTKCVEGTTYHKTMRLEGTLVHMKHVTELKDGNHYLEHAIETKDIEGDEVIKGWAASEIIKLRTRFIRAMTGAEFSRMDYVINPVDYPPSDRVGVPKRDKEIALLVKMKIPREIAEKMVDDPDNALDKISEIEEALTEPDYDLENPDPGDDENEPDHETIEELRKGIKNEQKTIDEFKKEALNK